MMATMRHSTLPKAVCAMPEIKAVPTSERCTAALTVAGASPTATIRLEEVTP